MSDNKNMELSDEMMAKASGGTNSAPFPAKYAVGDRVICPQRPEFGKGIVLKVYYDDESMCWYYDVQFPDYALEPGFIYDGMINESLAHA